MNQQTIKRITEYIFLRSNPGPADLAMIFGTRHPEAISSVYQLYISKLVPKILVSGGINIITGLNEAKEMGEALMQLGVRRQDILLEDQSTNSLENVIFSKKVIEEQLDFKNVKKVIAVVKHYHSRRALMTLKRHFPKNVELILVTYSIYGFTKDDWFSNETGRKKVIDEWTKIPSYLRKGDLEEL